MYVHPNIIDLRQRSNKYFSNVVKEIHLFGAYLIVMYRQFKFVLKGA